MFSDSSIAANVSMNKTKCAYLINYGIAPHFKKLLGEDILQCTPMYSVSFDESLNTVLQQQQMDIQIW